MRELTTPSDLPGGDPLAFLDGRLAEARRRIGEAAERAGRDAADVELVAVTKYVDTGVIRLLYQLGLRDFGENRIQELTRKREALGDLEDARFHMVGHLQRNKARKALQLSPVIHSLDSVRLLEELDRQIADLGIVPPTLYVEVNISGEPRKTGLPEADLRGLLEAAAGRPAIRGGLQGLMAMAPWSSDPEDARPYFRRLRELRDGCRDEGLLPEDAGLSMGMTADFEVAVEEGATVVRIGTFLYERDGEDEAPPAEPADP